MKTILGTLTVIIGFLAPAQAQSFLTNGLVAYYPFNGNANDASGHGNNGIVMNAQLTTNRFGQASAAYEFDGVQSSNGSRIVVTNKLLNTGQSGYTIQMWFDSYSDSQGGVMFDTYFNSVGIGIGYSYFTAPYYAGSLIGAGSSWDLRLDGNSTTPLAFNQLHSNAWYCATLTKSNTVYCFYINGKLQFTGTNSLAASYNFNDGFTLGSDGWDETFYGAIDDARIYNRALSSSEVAQLYAIESAPIVNIQKAVYLTSNNLWTGSNYQVQASSDLINWTNQGSVFTATTNYWDVANWNQLFFRLQLAP
jgi:hypothetical protein